MSALALETISGRNVKLVVLWLADYLSDFLTSVFTVSSWESNISILPFMLSLFQWDRDLAGPNQSCCKRSRMLLCVPLPLLG